MFFRLALEAKALTVHGKPVAPSLELRFGVGVVYGIVMLLKSFCVDTICVKDQSAVVALEVDDLSDLRRFGGLLGLALPSDSQNPYGETFLKQLPKDLVFALSLNELKPFLAFGSLKELLPEDALKVPVPPGHSFQKSSSCLSNLRTKQSDGRFSLWTVSMGMEVSSQGQPQLIAKGAFRCAYSREIAEYQQYQE